MIGDDDLKTKDLVLCALCAALTCILAPLSIPTPGGVPISLATFAVMLSGLVLGGKLGALSQLVYVLLGSAGLPVFAGWTGGAGLVLGMTGGYIIGYIFLAFFTGLIYFSMGRNAGGKEKYIWMAVSMVIGTAVLYAFGTAWFIKVTGMDLAASLSACVLPFLPGDALKIAGAAVLGGRLEKALRHV